MRRHVRGWSRWTLVRHCRLAHTRALTLRSAGATFVTDAGVVELAQKCRALRSLEAQRCRLGAEALQALAFCVPMCVTER